MPEGVLAVLRELERADEETGATLADLDRLAGDVDSVRARVDKLEAFASFHGADFYRLRRNRGTITLRKETWSVPSEMPFGTATLVPLRAGESVGWRLA